MLIIGGFASGKTHGFLNLVTKKIVTILLTKVICMQKNKTKHQFLIKKREDVGIKNLNDPKVFIEYR